MDDPRERSRVAAELCELARTRRDTLPLWHLLQEAQEETQRLAAERLALLAGAPASVDLTSLRAVSPEQRDDWREFLWPDPYGDYPTKGGGKLSR